jgi:hypothetical protein
MNRWSARPMAVRFGYTPCSCAISGTRPDQTSVTQTEMTTAATRSARLRESAANGSAQRMYHGISQLTQTTASSATQPAGVAQLRVSQATAAPAPRAPTSTSVMTWRTPASAPPRPAAYPIRLGKL